MKKITENKNWFNYVILGVVLLIPFIYSFFYLKAYWNPYGEGNLDNLPVAIVNEDDNILDEIKNLDILSMTPLDAMNALFSLQKKVKNK